MGAGQPDPGQVAQPGPEGGRAADKLYCGTKGRHVWAVVFAVLTVAVACTQGLYSQATYDRIQYSSYYFLCWFSQSFLLVSFPLFLAFAGPLAPCERKLLSRRSASAPDSDPSSISISISSSAPPSSTDLNKGEFKSSFTLALEDTRSLFLKNQQGSDGSRRNGTLYVWIGAVRWKIVLAMFALATLNLASGYLWYTSLAYIPFSLNQALFTTVCAFTFLIGVCVGAEVATLPKLVATLFSLLGTALLCLSPFMGSTSQSSSASSSSDSAFYLVLGSLMAVGSGLCYAIFVVLYQKVIGLNTAAMVLLSQTILGLFVLTVWWLPILPITLLGLEPPPGVMDKDGVFGFLMINAVLSVLYYVFYVFSITTGEPTFATVVTVSLSIGCTFG
ncbi:hypothetical protein Pelo_11867 [Pelomyxa schiedti]|nr:hypothetical protein Pelo_11867 [Pelomyxa schiedti]